MESEPRSLDDEYLGFCNRTAEVFGEYPELEPLRRLLFKEILVRKHRGSLLTPIKRWARPLLRRGGTTPRYDGDVGVLFWIDNPREVVMEQLLPLMEELPKRGIQALVLSHGLDRHFPVPQIPFDFQIGVGISNSARVGWRRLCEIEPKLRGGRELFLDQVSVAEGVIREFDRVLTSVRPKLVITAASNDSGGAAINVVASRLGIRTAVIQHGIPEVFYTPILADRFLAWGQSSKDRLLSLGVRSEEIVVVGSPRHDRIGTDAGSPATPSLPSLLGLPKLPSFVFFSNGNDLVRNGNAPIECARWLDRAATEFKNRINVIVRLHPNENGQLYTEYRNLVISKAVPSLHETLNGCDALGALCSTVMLEGLLYRKPVWQFHPQGYPMLADNWKTGLAYRISSESELLSRLQSIVDGEATTRDSGGVIGRVFANHTSATVSVCDWIEEELFEVDRH